MRFRRNRREVPLLNTTSTADISFILLILFLVTSSMDIDKGLSRQLPPITPSEQEPADVKEGMVLKLIINNDNSLQCDGEAMQIGKLRNTVETFVQEKGKEHVIQLEADRQSSYDTYFKVQNEIVAAYHSLRNAKALRMYGKSYYRCTETEQKQVREQVPQRISEVYHTEKGGDE